MNVFTLIAVTVLSGPAPGPMPQLMSFSSMSTCQKVLESTAQGVKAVYVGNAVGVHRDVQTTKDDKGWTVLRTPMGRVIAQFKCEAP